MKAIDFACRFLSRVHRESHAPAAMLVLISVGAGLEEKDDISRQTGLSPSVCTTQLRLLMARGELRCPSILVERYILTPAGKEHLRRLFDFHSAPPHG